MVNENIDVYRDKVSPSELKALRRKLAKRANQRLVRLERAKSKVTGESYDGIGASAIAKAYLEGQKKGRNRFQERADAITDINALRREITVLRQFLESKSSLVSGLRDIEQKRIAAFSSGKWGNKYTKRENRALKFASLKEFYDFLNSSLFRDLISTGLTSEQVVESYDEAVETYKGSTEEAEDALRELLKKFRSRGRASVKELKKAAKGKPLS